MRHIAFAALLAGAAVVPASAEPSKEAKAFGAREFIQDISLSPDGSKVAIIRPDGPRASVLLVSDFTPTGTKPVTRVSGEPERLFGCQWNTDTRLVCTIYSQSTSLGILAGFSRVIALDANGGNQKLLTQTNSSRALGLTQYGGRIIDWTGDESGKSGSVLMMRAYIPDNTIGTRLASSAEGLGVEAIDSSTLKRHNVEDARPMAVDYVSDGRGTVRIMGMLTAATGGYMGDTIAYSYRKPGSRDWQRLGSYKIGEYGNSGFNPYAVDPDLNVVYGFDDSSGLKRLVRISLDGSLKQEVVLARPDTDVDGLIKIGRQQRVVGASWAGEKREFAFFDPELKKLAASLGRAIPNLPQIRFVDASADETKLLLLAASDDNPGVYYLFDKMTKKLEEVLPARPELEGMKLAKVKPVSYRAADGTTIPGYLTLPAGSDGKNLPTIVMPHGGPEARDEWGFDWLAQFFAARGYAVLQPNFRGSTGYGEAFFMKNGYKSWRMAIGDVNDGGRWLLSQGIAAPGKLVIFGWSYGGYAALQSTALDPDLFKAIVAVAPVTDLETRRNERRNYADFALQDKRIGSGPHVREGSPASHAAEFKAPVLLFHGDKDENVGVGESRLMADRLRGAGKQVEYVEYKGLDHQLEDSAARAEMLDKSDAFFRAAIGK